ncbi:MAG: hypothetical protein HY538_01085 [Deltaproteobacteria bacterium]|nr:hypothetical protein [Deltaproteobacteria bacterium]
MVSKIKSNRFFVTTHKIFSWVLVFALVYGPLPTREAHASFNYSSAAAHASDESALKASSNSVGSTLVDAKGNLTYSLSFPSIPVVARDGSSPSVSVTYNSANHQVDGFMGYGWNLDVPSIRRIGPDETLPLPTYGTDDRFSTPWGIVVPIENPDQSETGYRLISGPFAIHFTFDRVENVWTVRNLENGTKQIFRDMKGNPATKPDVTDPACQLELPLGDSSSGCPPGRELLCEALDNFDPTSYGMKELNEDLLEEGTIDYGAFLEDYEDQGGGIRIWDVLVTDAAKQIEETQHEPRVGDLDGTVFDEGDIGGSGPTNPEGVGGGVEGEETNGVVTKNLDPTVQEDIERSRITQNPVISPSWVDINESNVPLEANKTAEWQIQEIQNGSNWTRHYYASCSTADGKYNVFHWNGVASGGYAFGDSDGPSFAIRALYDLRQNYYPISISNHTFSPEILSALELRPVVAYYDSSGPYLDEDYLNMRMKFVYESDSDAHHAPLVVKIKFETEEDGETESFQPPLEMAYIEKQENSGTVKAFCKDPVVLPFFKPLNTKGFKEGETDAYEWVRSSRSYYNPETEDPLTGTILPFASPEVDPAFIGRLYNGAGYSLELTGLHEIGNVDCEESHCESGDRYQVEAPNISARFAGAPLFGEEQDNRPDFVIATEMERFTYDPDYFGFEGSGESKKVCLKDGEGCWDYYGKSGTTYVTQNVYTGVGMIDPYSQEGTPYGSLEGGPVNYDPGQVPTPFVRVYYGVPKKELPQDLICDSEENTPCSSQDDYFGGGFILGPYHFFQNFSLEGLSQRNKEADEVYSFMDIDGDGLEEPILKEGECHIVTSRNGFSLRKSDVPECAQWDDGQGAIDEADCVQPQPLFVGQDRLVETESTGIVSQECDPDGRFRSSFNNTCNDTASQCYRFSGLPSTPIGALTLPVQDDEEQQSQNSGFEGFTIDGFSGAHWISGSVCDGNDCSWQVWWNNSQLLWTASQGSIKYDPSKSAFCSIPSNSITGPAIADPSLREALKCPVLVKNAPAALHQSADNRTVMTLMDLVGDDNPDVVSTKSGSDCWSVNAYDYNAIEGNYIAQFIEEGVWVYVPRDPDEPEDRKIATREDDEDHWSGVFSFGSQSFAFSLGEESGARMYCSTWGESTDEERSPGVSATWTCYPFYKGEVNPSYTCEGEDAVSYFHPGEVFRIEAPTIAQHVTCNDSNWCPDGDADELPGVMDTIRGSTLLAPADVNGDGIVDIIDIRPEKGNHASHSTWDKKGMSVYFGCRDDQFEEGEDDTRSCDRCPEERLVGDDDEGSGTNAQWVGLLTEVSDGSGLRKVFEWADVKDYRFVPPADHSYKNLLEGIPILKSVTEYRFEDGLESYQVSSENVPIYRTYDYLSCFKNSNGVFAGCPAIREISNSGEGNQSETTTYYLLQFPEGLDVTDYSELNPPSSAVSTVIWPSSTVRKLREIQGAPWAQSVSVGKKTVIWVGDIPEEDYDVIHESYGVLVFPEGSTTDPITQVGTYRRDKILSFQPKKSINIQIEGDYKVVREKQLLYETFSSSDPKGFVGYLMATRQLETPTSGGVPYYRDLTVYNKLDDGNGHLTQIVPNVRCRDTQSLSATITCDPSSSFLYRDYDYNDDGTLRWVQTVSDTPLSSVQSQIEQEYEYDGYGHLTHSITTVKHGSSGLRSMEEEFIYDDYSFSPGLNIDKERFLAKEITRGSDMESMVQYFVWDRKTSKIAFESRLFLEGQDPLGESSGGESAESCWEDESCREGGTERVYDHLGRPVRETQFVPLGTDRQKALSQCYYYSGASGPLMWSASVSIRGSNCWGSLPDSDTLAKYPYEKVYRNSWASFKSERSSDGSYLLRKQARFDGDGAIVAESLWDDLEDWDAERVEWASQTHDSLGRITGITLPTGYMAQITPGLEETSVADPNWVADSWTGSTGVTVDGMQRTFKAGIGGKLSHVALGTNTSQMVEADYEDYDVVGDANTITLNPLFCLLNGGGVCDSIMISQDRDSWGRIVETTRPETGRQRVLYDGGGLLVVKQNLDESGSQVLRTQFVRYDGQGRPLEIQYLDGSKYSTSISSLSSLPDLEDTREDADVVINYTYDLDLLNQGCSNAGLLAWQNRIERYPDPEEEGTEIKFWESRQFCWDTAGRIQNQKIIHWREEISEEDGAPVEGTLTSVAYEIANSYDAYGRLVDKTDTYTDQSGNQSLLRTVFRYQADLPLLVSDASDGAAIETSQGVIVKRAYYDLKGRLERVVLGNGTVLQYEFDRFDRIRSIMGCLEEDLLDDGECDVILNEHRLLLYQEIEERDPAGNILIVEEGRNQLSANQIIREFQYNGLHQLTLEQVRWRGTEPPDNYDTESCGELMDVCWDHHDSGDYCRNERTDQWVSHSCCKDAQGVLFANVCTHSDPLPSVDYLYRQEFDYDGVGNRALQTRTQGGASETYTYSYGNSHRLYSVEGSSSTRYLYWNEDGTLERDASTQQRDFHWSPSGQLRAVSVNDSAETYFYGTDNVRSRKETENQIVDYFGESLTAFHVGDSMTTVVRNFGIPGSNLVVASLTDGGEGGLSFDDNRIEGPIPCGLFESQNPTSQSPWGFLIVVLYLLILIGLWRWKRTCEPGALESISLLIAFVFLVQSVIPSSVYARTTPIPREPSQQSPVDSRIGDLYAIEGVGQISDLLDQGGVSPAEPRFPLEPDLDMPDPIIDDWSDTIDDWKKDPVECAPNSESTLRFFMNDYRGNLAVVSDDKGCILKTVSYTAFGEDVCELDSSLCYNAEGEETLASSVDPNFIGKQKDDLAGLIVTDARYYDPALGIFISPEPVDELTIQTTGGEVQDFYKDPLLFNSYAYAGQNPINRSDPSGEFWFAAALLFAQFLAVAAVAFVVMMLPHLFIGAVSEAYGVPYGWGRAIASTALSAATMGFFTEIIAPFVMAFLGVYVPSAYTFLQYGPFAAEIGAVARTGAQYASNAISGFSYDGLDLFFDVLSFTQSVKPSHFVFQGPITSPTALNLSNRWAWLGYTVVKSSLKIGAGLNSYYNQYKARTVQLGFDAGRYLARSFAQLSAQIIQGLSGGRLAGWLLYRDETIPFGPAIGTFAGVIQTKTTVSHQQRFGDLPTRVLSQMFGVEYQLYDALPFDLGPASAVDYGGLE